MEIVEKNKKGRCQRIISVAVTVVLILSVVLCAYAAIQVMSKGYVSIGGLMMFRVVTGSMEPTIPTGALMITRQTQIETVSLGEIVCFRTQESAIWGKIVTHRVVDILTQPDGSPLLVTKGDANLVTDAYYVTRDNFVGKVIWHTGDHSKLASIFSFFTSKIGFLGCIVFPCLLLATLILRECVSNIRSELREYIKEIERVEAQKQEIVSGGLTRQEYEEMAERIQAELMEEMEQYAEILKAELAQKE